MSEIGAPLLSSSHLFWFLLVPFIGLPVVSSPFFYSSRWAHPWGSSFPGLRCDIFASHSFSVLLFNVSISSSVSSFWGVSVTFFAAWVAIGPFFFFFTNTINSLPSWLETYSVSKMSALLSFIISLIEAFGAFLRWGTVILRLAVNLIVGGVILSLLPSSCPFSLLNFSVISVISNSFFFLLLLFLFVYELIVAYFQVCLFFYLVILYSTEESSFYYASPYTAVSTRPSFAI